MQRPLLALTLACLACMTGVTCVTSRAGAQPVLITSPQTLSQGATTITPTAGGAAVPLETADIMVRGTTLTVNGKHTIRNLVVENNGVITHSQGFSYDADPVEPGVQEAFGMWLEVVANPVGGDVVVGVGSRIDVSERGYAARQGPGASDGRHGGSHGGRGGSGDFGTYIGTVYGSATQPNQLGSGGANSRGGGTIRLGVSNTLRVEGTIRADGQSNFDGGSGGSVWISAGIITGVGSISANAGTFNNGGNGHGGGGGGRVAVYSHELPSVANITAYGGIGYRSGGAGTVYVKTSGDSGTVIYDNGSVTNGETWLVNNNETFANVIVRGHAWLTHNFGSEEGLSLTCTENLQIIPPGRIDATSRGNIYRAGPGASDGRHGGSHAGRGGTGDFGTYVGSVYGSATQPNQLGSGGGNSRGGGKIRLSIGATLEVDGAIRADGESNFDGGSGGSIWIDAEDITGTGSITANGGTFNNGGNGHGGGGGGRIALYTERSPSVSSVTAYGGNGFQRGGAGTIFYRSLGGKSDVLVYDNGTTLAVNAESPIRPVQLTSNVDHLIIRSGARVQMNEQLTLGSLTISNHGTITHHPINPDGLPLSVLDNLTIDETSSIDVSERGFTQSQGPGASDGRSGASHGGRGGTGDFGSYVGPVYGSATQPNQLGSGGGNSRGGGKIRLTVGGTLHVDGTIRADGQANFDGGSGGSIWISAGTITGSGRITANGGIFNNGGNGHGGGGGGRIALYCDSLPTVSNITAFGGIGYRSGGAGTVYIKTSSDSGTVIFDNGSIANGETWLVNNNETFANVIIRGQAWLTHSSQQEDGLALTCIESLHVIPPGRIDASGRGYLFRAGPGASDGRSGGSHGGRGGTGDFGTYVGPTYGSETQPNHLGSGGGNSRGGGKIRLTVGGTLHVDGTIRADGEAFFDGGSGGSIWISAGAIIGGGSITATGGTFNNGGNGHGGGGGGRIALYSCNITTPISSFSVLGGNGFQPGQPGTLYFGSSSIDITQQPIGGNYRGGDFFQLGVQATSPNGELTYQWRKKNEAGEFVPLVEGQGGVFTEVTSNTLFVSGVSCDGGGDYDCLICDSCGCFPSNIANLNVQSIADFNNDGGIDGSDIEAFFTAWESGDSLSDVNLDGGIDGSDVELFFLRWEGGC